MPGSTRFTLCLRAPPIKAPRPPKSGGDLSGALPYTALNGVSSSASSSNPNSASGNRSINSSTPAAAITSRRSSASSSKRTLTQLSAVMRDDDDEGDMGALCGDAEPVTRASAPRTHAVALTPRLGAVAMDGIGGGRCLGV